MPNLHPEVRALSEIWRAVPPEIRADATQIALMDQRYHENLVELTGNAKLLDTLRRVDERLFAFRVMGFELAIEQGTLEESFSIHLGLAWAILSGDPGNIRKALEQNIMQGRSNVTLALGKALTRAYSGSSGSGN